MMNPHNPPSFLTMHEKEVIAYHKHNGKQNTSLPTIVFLGGFMSDMQGTKALALEQFAKTHDLSYIRFDYMGHGQSSKRFEEGTIGLWKQNVLAVIDQLTQGPLLLIGSSMGGWLMLLAALERRERVQALIGIASAPDFTENLIWDVFTDEMKHKLMTEGVYNMGSEYSETPYPITKQLIEEARQHLVLNKPLPITCPVRLLHGMKDDDVPYTLSIELAKKLQSTDVRIELAKNSDHRMSSEEDVALLCGAIEEVLGL